MASSSSPLVTDLLFSSASFVGGSHDLTIDRRLPTVTLALFRNTSAAVVVSGIKW